MNVVDTTVDITTMAGKSDKEVLAMLAKSFGVSTKELDGYLASEEKPKGRKRKTVKK